MRLVTMFCTLVLLSGFAAAQATVIGGNASNWPPAYGVYAAPFVPLVTTPSVSFSTFSPSAAGASNATGNLVAGATDATLSLVNTPPQTVLTVPTWYGPTPAQFVAGVSESETPEPARHGHGFLTGSASSQFDHGVAELAGLTRPSGKATRTITNEDVDRMNQNTGMVKYDGKTENIQ